MSVEGLTDEEVKKLKEEFGVSEEEIKSEIDSLKSNSGTGWSPEPPAKDDLLRFLRDILGLKDKEADKISRVGNLKDDELGRLPLTVRTYLNIARYAEAEHLTEVSEYLRGKANIWANTSLSRKGFFVRLPFTSTRISKDLGKPITTEKKGLFSSQTIKEGVEEE